MANDTHPLTLGADLRALRRTRGMTLACMAEQLDRSVGWLSQVERNLSIPTPDDLSQMADLLDVSTEMLTRHVADVVEEDGFVVRSDQRRPIGPRVAGLTEELLSPDLTDDFEVVHSIFAPGSHTAAPVIRPTQELGYLISGRLDLTISARRFTIGPGDSFRMRGEPFEWCNPYDTPAVAIWVIAPPVY